MSVIGCFVVHNTISLILIMAPKKCFKTHNSVEGYIFKMKNEDIIYYSNV